jgi:hypothetical protein
MSDLAALRHVDQTAESAVALCLDVLKEIIEKDDLVTGSSKLTLTEAVNTSLDSIKEQYLDRTVSDNDLPCLLSLLNDMTSKYFGARASICTLLLSATVEANSRAYQSNRGTITADEILLPRKDQNQTITLQTIVYQCSHDDVSEDFEDEDVDPARRDIVYLVLDLDARMERVERDVQLSGADADLLLHNTHLQSWRRSTWRDIEQSEGRDLCAGLHWAISIVSDFIYSLHEQYHAHRKVSKELLDALSEEGAETGSHGVQVRLTEAAFAVRKAMAVNGEATAAQASSARFSSGVAAQVSDAGPSSSNVMVQASDPEPSSGVATRGASGTIPGTSKGVDKCGCAIM